LKQIPLTSDSTDSVDYRIAMPLMFVVFGRLVGNFAGYFTPGSSVTQAAFKHQVVQNTLYMVYIGIARFALSFISLVSIGLQLHHADC
jgi:ATP-binding cassette subfamily B (MDR/TAP) protein 1